MNRSITEQDIIEWGRSVDIVMQEFESFDQFKQRVIEAYSVKDPCDCDNCAICYAEAVMAERARAIGEHSIGDIEWPSPIEQQVLIKVIEECAEITKATSKILRFGKNRCHPGTDVTNVAKLQDEMLDMRACIALLIQHGYIPEEFVPGEIAKRMEKFYEYLKIGGHDETS